MRLNYVKEWFLNPRIGMFSFLFQRLTGLALVGYVFLHLYSIGSARLLMDPVTDPTGQVAFNRMMASYNTPIFHIFEYLLLLCVAFHMFNGIRIVVADWFGMTKMHVPLFYLSCAFVLVIAIFSFGFFFPEVMR